MVCSIRNNFDDLIPQILHPKLDLLHNLGTASGCFMLHGLAPYPHRCPQGYGLFGKFPMIRGQAESDISEDSDDEGSDDSDPKQQSGELSPPAGTGARSEATGKSAGGDRQDGFEDAVNELDDLVAGMNTFVADTSAGPDGAEVEVVGGDVQFDVDKFMSLFNSADLR